MRVASALVLLTLALAACDDAPDARPVRVITGPVDDEAEDMALWLRGSDLPRAADVARLHGDLAHIRASVPELADYEGFGSPGTGLIFAMATPELAQGFATSTAGRAVLSRFAATALAKSIVPTHVLFESSFNVGVAFLARSIAAVPGVTEVATDGMIGPYPTGWICTDLDAPAPRLYVFRRGFGDCPSGCLAYRFTAATVAADGSVTVVDRWHRGSEVPPEPGFEAAAPTIVPPTTCL